MLALVVRPFEEETEEIGIASDVVVETPYPLSYCSIGYENNHMVISVPYPNAKAAQRMRRLHSI